jgi:1,2-phenylacetyl-CoA epoxidase PaaB subunit
MIKLSDTPADQQANRKQMAEKPATKVPAPRQKKRRPTTGELIDGLSKYEWNFEAMKRA